MSGCIRGCSPLSGSRGSSLAKRPGATGSTTSTPSSDTWPATARRSKFFLNVSREEQRQRFLDRINEPDKHWKFSASDIAERGHWDAYMEAYEAAIGETSTEHAPWYVIPADKKWVSRAAVGAVLAGTIRRLGLEWPTVGEAKREQIEAARRTLDAEG